MTSQSPLETLYPHFPAIIDQMPEVFTSHQFIQALTKRISETMCWRWRSMRTPANRSGKSIDSYQFVSTGTITW